VCPGLNVSRALGPRSLVGMNSARFLIRLSERRSDLLLSTLFCRLVIDVSSDARNFRLWLAEAVHPR
jgi:hypothetical protein